MLTTKLLKGKDTKSGHKHTIVMFYEAGAYHIVLMSGRGKVW